MFPAHAGMNRRTPLILASLPNVPRTRGDEPRQSGCISRPGLMFPAHAGMNRRWLPWVLLGTYVPRTRGMRTFVYGTAKVSNRDAAGICGARRCMAPHTEADQYSIITKAQPLSGLWKHEGPVPGRTHRSAEPGRTHRSAPTSGGTMVQDDVHQCVHSRCLQSAGTGPSKPTVGADLCPPAFRTTRSCVSVQRSATLRFRV